MNSGKESTIYKFMKLDKKIDEKISKIKSIMSSIDSDIRQIKQRDSASNKSKSPYLKDIRTYPSNLNYRFKDPSENVFSTKKTNSCSMLSSENYSFLHPNQATTSRTSKYQNLHKSARSEHLQQINEFDQTGVLPSESEQKQLLQRRRHGPVNKSTDRCLERLFSQKEDFNDRRYKKNRNASFIESQATATQSSYILRFKGSQECVTQQTSEEKIASFRSKVSSTQISWRRDGSFSSQKKSSHSQQDAREATKSTFQNSTMLQLLGINAHENTINGLELTDGGYLVSSSLDHYVKVMIM